MAIIICKECGKEISSKAKSCPYCGIPFKTQNSSGIGCIIIIIVFVLFFVFLTEGARKAAYMARRARDMAGLTSSPSNVDIYVEAQLYVEKCLKTPGSVKFPHSSACKISNIGTNKYRVSSYVDSQNSFGALLRTYYTVEMEYLGNDKWQLIDIKFNE